MALIDCKFYSEALKISTSMMVILPQKTRSQIGMVNNSSNGRHKTLYLLHGLTDDHTIWLRRTSIERYASPLGIAIVMPSVERSFYTDMIYGSAYETFIADELPEICRSFFPLSDAREDNYLAGLSMGGYGAFKIALNYPANYAAAASLSGVLDLVSAVSAPDSDFKQDFWNIFGLEPSIKGTRHDLFFAVKQCKAEGRQMPRLFQCCGEQDFLYQQNLDFYDFALREKLPLTWQVDPGYGHTWSYWDMRIQTVLKWMFS